MNRNPVSWPAALLVAAAINTSIAATAFAADPHQGKQLAERWCAACHFVGGKSQAPDAAPPFGQMASESAYPDARLRGWLHDPHPPMPNLTLSRYDIDDIVAYIRSLKP